MLDGIKPPENLSSKSCIFAFISIREFWKNWHSSMNLWIIRYIYIPLGGKNTVHFNARIIFTFVATWVQYF
jgi:D-alanyl-lipoteichoic acid acyltransferase DltB (MBOAT superfamily)